LSVNSGAPLAPLLGSRSPVDLSEELLDDESALVGLRDLKRRLVIQNSQGLTEPTACLFRVTENALCQGLNSLQSLHLCLHHNHLASLL
jgi:hypothetical protein